MARFRILRRSIILLFLCGIIGTGLWYFFYDPAGRLTLSPLDLPQKSFAVDRADAYIRVVDDNNLNPLEKQNFILTVWVKLRKKPDDGETITLLSKIDSSLRSQRGYSLSLQNEEGVVRPIVYWRNGQSIGGEYRFTEFPIEPKTWVMFGLSLTGEEYLGLHAVTLGKKKNPQVTLLGGYKLSVPVFPDSASDLLLGSYGREPFRGRVGPVGVFSFEKKKSSLHRILKTIAAGMDEIPSDFDKDQIKLWLVEGTQDLSTSKHQVMATGSSKRKREQEEPKDKTSVVPTSNPNLALLTPSPVPPTPTLTATPTMSPTPTKKIRPTKTPKQTPTKKEISVEKNKKSVKKKKTLVDEKVLKEETKTKTTKKKAKATRTPTVKPTISKVHDND